MCPNHYLGKRVIPLIHGARDALTIIFSNLIYVQWKCPLPQTQRYERGPCLRFDPDECFTLRVVGLAALPRVWTLLERVGEAAKCALGLHLGEWDLTYENESVR
jgi:hypothetical protein